MHTEKNSEECKDCYYYHNFSFDQSTTKNAYY